MVEGEDKSAMGREEKSGKVVVLLKSGRGDMVTKVWAMLVEPLQRLNFMSEV